MTRPLARFRIGFDDVVRLVVVWCACVLVLILADLVLPGLSTDTQWAWFATTAIAALAGLLVRPALVVISARLGWLVVVLVGLFGQAGHRLSLLRARAGRARHVLGRVHRLLAGGPRVVAGDLGRDDRFERRLRRRAGAPAPARRGERPRGGRRPVRAARRRPVPGAPVGGAGRRRTDHPPLDHLRRLHAARVDPAAAVHHTGQPAGHPARHRRRSPGLPLVRPGARPGRRRQQAA